MPDYDSEWIEAAREVDAMLPGTPPIAPPLPAPRRRWRVRQDGRVLVQGEWIDCLEIELLPDWNGRAMLAMQPDDQVDWD